MKKGGFLRNVLDTIRSNQASGSSGRAGGSGERGYEFGGQLKPSHFSLCQVARHGFPDQPTAIAFDPVQKIVAIGTKSGALRIFGRPGAEICVQHEPMYAVTHIRFVVNQGAIITVTADESIHLWSLRGPNLKLQFTAGGQGNSPQASSPAPTPASNISSVSPQSGSSITTSGLPGGGGTSSATSPSSFLGQITDTVSGAVDSASDFLSGGGGGGTSNDHFSTASLMGTETRQSAHKHPEILHTLKFQREHITYIHQTLTSKWLYIGTERGNVHVANIETFELSGYSIAWNKAIELSRKAHPGAIIHLSECPQDTNKLLIGYESGCIVLWDLKQRNADGRYYNTENLLWLAWHYEGKQFVAAHGDGSLATWQTRSNQKPALIQYPHAKTAGGQQQQQQQYGDLVTSQQLGAGGAASLARSLCNELYRPINKVEWKTSKSSNEQFYLFSGGLPYDGFDQTTAAPAPDLGKPPSRQSASASGTARQAGGSQQYLQTASSQSGGQFASPSPMSPSMSPSLQQQDSFSGGGGTKTSAYLQREKKCLRSTSLTVMYGKSITVLEMDDTIIDFITICDHSPYENDSSDPYAVIVLLSNELILIDLTSSGYPSFDSPYSSTSLNESPVTCVQYLADCSSDLIPFLYSTSQNVISRAPKKGFSDKEWPINGGEWGQSMQSYPELVLTGHADGTIKFWDMSGVNFDLISKIKTSKLFEKPNKPPNAIFISMNGGGSNENVQARGGNTSKRMADQYDQCSTRTANDLLEMNQTTFDESIFAIEKIEFCSATKRLLVAGACAQVIQFKLSKKESHASAAAAELTTIMVEPTTVSSNNANSNVADQHHLGTNQAQWKQHSLLQVKGGGGGGSGSVGSSSCGSSSSSSSNRGRSALSGFSAELICLTPLLVSTMPPNEDYTIVGGSSLMSSGENQSGSTTKSANIQYYCQISPKITALAFQATHNILAYAHKSGIVLVDIIQKCVIINASLSDLYGGAGSSSLVNRDISIQPYATSSILQHHYQQQQQQQQQQTTSPTSSAFVSGTSTEPFSHHLHHHSQAGEHGKLSDNGSAAAGQQQLTDSSDNERTMDGMLNKHSGLGNAPDGGQIASPTRNTKQSQQQQPAVQSRYTNSMFQRQLSTNALNTGSQAVSSPSKQSASRLFQRQMTAAQLFSSGNNGSSGSPTSLSFASCGPQQDRKRLLANARADLNLASSSTANLTTATTTTPNRPTSAMLDSGALSGGGGGGKKVPKNKRILSRMLSISAIHTTVGSSSSAAAANDLTSTQQTPNLSGYQSDETGQSQSTVGGGSGGSGGGGGDQQRSDKFDSSFRRSRSSSTSSTNGAAGGANVTQSGDSSAQASESIQCLAFVDPAQAGALFAASGGHQAAGSLSGGVGGSACSSGAGGPTATSTTTATTTSGTTSASSAAQAAAAAAGGHQVQSSASGGSNHKSLSPIDIGQQAAGQLALWLGTSSGGLLLVGLQMPDNEDNRVLQLQSINAEPIPQTSIKLSGQILCLTAFTCEARAQQQHFGTGSSQLTSGSAAARSTSQSSSLEGDTLMQSPGSSGSSGSASGGGGGGGATSGGGQGGGGGSVSSSGFGGSPGATGASFDVRSSLFLAVVSEKQARVYQVSSSNQPLSQQQQQQQQYHSSSQTSQSGGGGGGGGGSKSADQRGHHHSSLPLADTPLASLLANKKNLVAECDISDSSFACCSAVVQMRTPDECCLLSYLANGNLVVHSLPRLKPVLMDADFVPYTSSRVSSSMRFARNGHCLYQPSMGEISKFTISAQYKSLVNDMLGLLYVPREMPEMPRTNFFKSLFSASQSAKQSDRDELFGECSAGKPVRGVAKHIGTAGNASGAGGGGQMSQMSQMDKLKSAAVGTMGHDMRVAREGLDERGEKLSEIEDQTLRMLNQSESYSQAAHQLAQKFKDKKWYQF